MADLQDYFMDIVKHSSVAVDSQTNAIATATIAAVPGQHNVLCKVDCSYSAVSVAGLITVTVGSLVITKYIHGAGALDFGLLGLQNPTVNEAITVALADGGVGITGTVAATYYHTGSNA